MNILITGGLGFIGAHLERRIKPEHNVFIVDRDRISRDNYYRGDICDYSRMEMIFSQVKPDIVLHLAAMVSRKECEETPYMAIQTNVDGTLNIILLCLKYKARLIYAGSSEEYGTAFDNCIVNESIPFGEPTSIYSLTKRMSEEIIQYYAFFKGLKATTLRFFMLYGPGERPSDYRSAIIRFIDAAMKNEELKVHKDTVRQWCYIDDAVSGILHIIERKQEKNYEDYNIGGQEVTATEDLATLIIRLTGSQSRINVIAPEETIIPKKVADFSKMKNTFGWFAAIPLESGLLYVIKDFSNH